MSSTAGMFKSMKPGQGERPKVSLDGLSQESILPVPEWDSPKLTASLDMPTLLKQCMPTRKDELTPQG